MGRLLTNQNVSTSKSCVPSGLSYLRVPPSDDHAGAQLVFVAIGELHRQVGRPPGYTEHKVSFDRFEVSKRKNK